MQFQIENRPVFTTLKILLEQGESFKAEPGAMVSMSPAIETQAKGSGKGLRGVLKAAVGGEWIFASLFTAAQGPGELVLAPPTPGDIIQFDLTNQTIMAQSGAYMAGNPDLELSTEGSLRAMISGEGLFLQKISGTGTVFFASYGAVFEKKLAAGESYIVDTGHMVAFESGVTYTVKLVSKGFFSSMASGEGLVCNFTGPGSVWVQSRNLSAFAGLLAKLLPNK